MTGELEAAAADSVAHLARRGGRHAPAPGAACANCGAVLQGRYCHACGQGADTHKRSIRHLIWEALEAIFELDGRLWKTVPALFFRPGRLARDYMQGRLARHVPPFRTFLIALVLFVFAAEHATHQMTLDQQHAKAAETARLATPQGRAAAVARRRVEAAQSLKAELQDAASDRADALKDKDIKPERAEASYAREVAKARARYDHALARADRVARGLPADTPESLNAAAGKDAGGWFKTGVKKATDNPDYYWSVVFNWAHRLAVILLPIVGFNLALVYRKRRDIFIYDHLLVAMNLLSFGFLISAAGLVLPFAAMPYWFGLVTLWTPVNLFQTLRGGYGSGILGAGLKTLIVWSFTAFAVLVLMTSLLVLAVAEV